MKYTLSIVYELFQHALTELTCRAGGSASRPASAAGSSLLKAVSVGAKTVKGASSPVWLPNAASRAASREEKRGSVASSSPVVGRLGSPAAGSAGRARPGRPEAESPEVESLDGQ